MKKPGLWVLVADATRARLFDVGFEGGKARLEQLQEMVGVNLRSRELASSPPGRSFDRHGPGRHAEEPQTDPKRYESLRFARELAEILDGERRKTAFKHLVVVAPPQFLGDLRACFDSHLSSKITAEVNKNLTSLSALQLVSHLDEVLRP